MAPFEEPPSPTLAAAALIGVQAGAKSSKQLGLVPEHRQSARGRLSTMGLLTGEPIGGAWDGVLSLTGLTPQRTSTILEAAVLVGCARASKAARIRSLLVMSRSAMDVFAPTTRTDASRPLWTMILRVQPIS